MRRAVLLSSSVTWAYGHGPNHPLKPERLRRTVELLSEYGALDAPNVRVVTPSPATDDELALFHTREYIDVVRALSAGDADLPIWQHGFGPGDNPVFENMVETESLKVGSAITAASRLVSGECDVAFSFSGGLHHARPGQASGFCVFNDAAVAIHWLLLQNLRVAYVDIDVHRDTLPHVSTARTRLGVNGISRTRAPVAAKIAFAIAGAVVMVAGSPAPAAG
jgi:acetoin utilization protein AcuC